MTQSLNVKTSQFKTTADSENESWLIFDLESDGLYDNVSKSIAWLFMTFNQETLSAMALMLLIMLLVIWTPLMF